MEQNQAADTAQKAMLDYMIYSVGDHVRRQAGNAAWREEVRDMRGRLEAYYASLEQSGAPLIERVKLSLFLADITRDLSAYAKAIEGYESTLKLWESLPEQERTSIAGRRMRSTISNGIGSCLLAQKKAEAALPYYEKSMEMDESLYRELAPANEEHLPAGDNISPDLLRAAEDVLSSYRCLAECQYAAEDPEEARDTFKKGREIAIRMRNLKPGMSIQYIRMLTSLGNLESACHSPRAAYAAWVEAIQLAQRLHKVAPTTAVQAQVARYIRELEPLIKSVGKELQEENARQKKEAESSAAPAQS